MDREIELEEKAARRSDLAACKEILDAVDVPGALGAAGMRSRILPNGQEYWPYSVDGSGFAHYGIVRDRAGFAIVGDDMAEKLEDLVGETDFETAMNEALSRVDRIAWETDDAAALYGRCVLGDDEGVLYIRRTPSGVEVRISGLWTHAAEEFEEHEDELFGDAEARRTGSQCRTRF